MSFKATHIVWMDSNGPSEQRWFFEAEIDDIKPTVIHTRGYILKETDEYVNIVQSFSDQDNYMGLMSIPKVAIIGRTDEENADG